jgi:uncharacterized membrane protein
VRLLAPAFGAGQPGVLYAINRPGETVGDSYLTDPAGIILADQATAWSAGGDPSLIPFLPGTNQSVALEVSDRGWVVGGAAEANYDTGSLSPTHAFLWLGDGPAETLPVPGLSYADSQSLAHGVDSQGTVVGSSGPVDGTASATVWTCARELAYTPASASTARTAIPTHTPARPSRATRRGWRMPREHVGPISATNPPRW